MSSGTDELDKTREFSPSAGRQRGQVQTCKLVVNKTEIVQTIYGSIQEFAGFNRPHWLVCDY